MADSQFASLNGAANYAAQVDDDEFVLDFTPSAHAIARRSISIFSRRGTEIPEPAPPFIAQAAMAKPTKPKREMSEKQKSWLSRSKSACKGSSPVKATKPKGTVLNAVPAAKTIKMTALEEEMATSPNEEILSALSEQSPTQQAWTAHSQLSPSTPTAAGFWHKSSLPGTHRTRSERRRDTDHRIGMWVNGIAQWDENVNSNVNDHHRWVEEAIEEETGFTPLHQHTPVQLNPGERPRLSVFIPTAAEPRINDTTVSTIVQPRQRRSMLSIAPASIVSKFNINTPTITVEPAKEQEQEHDVSPIESIRATPPAQEQHEDTIHLAVEPSSSVVRPRASRESTGSDDSSLAEPEMYTSSSNHSKRSSATSLEDILPVLPERSKKRLSGRALSLAPHPALEEPNVNKPLPPSPIPPPRRAVPAPPLARRSSVRPKSSSSSKSVPTGRSSTLQPALRGDMLKTRSLTSLDQLDADFIRSSPYLLRSGLCETPSASDLDETSTPTLSQAEVELHAQLAAIEDDVLSYEINMKPAPERRSTMTKSTSIRRSDSVRSVMQPPERAPTVPKRSRKRYWRAAKAWHLAQHMLTRRLSESNIRAKSDAATTTGVRRAVSAAYGRNSFAFDYPAGSSVPAQEPPPARMSSAPKIVIDDGLVVVHGPVLVGVSGEEQQAVAAASAEDVLLHILSALTSTEDLHNAALINKGMYRVYKENEMQLIRQVKFNQSPAAWEMREWSPPDREESDTSSKASSQLEHSPKSYTRCDARDTAVVNALKILILQRCQTFLRRETGAAFMNPLHSSAQRFDDAFWRIWCFCKIFGCEKGREDDITGQLDWLKGGLLANNQGFSATVNVNLDFDMGSVLLNAPDHFAKGNEGGLTAQQLYDMTEIWTSLCALLHGYQGRVDQARAAGVFEACDDMDEGNVEQEGQLLEEWLCHLLTLGPAVVLEMAELANDPSEAGFALAQLSGWTQWTTPTYSGTRATFLKEPVARLYEERIAAAAAAMQNPEAQEKKEVSRKRVASLAKEIRLKRQTSNYRRSPYIDQNSERPMSMLSRHNSTRSNRSSRSGHSSIVSPMTPAVYTSPVAMTPTLPPSSARNFSKPHHQGHQRKISPIIEEHVERFNRMSLQNMDGIAEDTSDRAVRKIVDMGFTSAQAREALRVTDMGDGLRVDRAVDLLLRRRS